MSNFVAGFFLTFSVFKTIIKIEGRSIRMKKFMMFFAILGAFSIFFLNNIVKAQEIKIEECIYTNIDSAILVYEVDDEGNDTYNIVFEMENKKFKHNIFQYHYVNFKDRQWICRTDLIEEASEVILLKLDISLASRTSYFIEMICMLAEDFSQLYRVTCLADYDLNEILVSESKNANEVLEIQALIEAIFNYLTSLLGVEPYDNEINVDEVLQTSMNQEGISYSYLQDNTKARNYEVFNNSAFLDQFVVCADDNIIEIIPIEVFFMNGPHLACGSGYGYYVNVMDETPSGDIKKCEVFVFEVNNFRKKDEDYSFIQIIPLFQQNFKAVTYSYDTSQIYSELFKISGKDRHVVSKGVDVPAYSISNPSETLLMEVIGGPNIGDENFDPAIDQGACLQNLLFSVDNPKDYHADLDDVSGNALYNNLSNLLYYLSDFHIAISLANKIKDILEVLTGYKKQMETNKANLEREFSNTRKLNFATTIPKPRCVTFGGNLNNTYVYIGEADTGSAKDKNEMFSFQNIYYMGGDVTTFRVQELVTFCLNRYNYSYYNKYYSREKILAVHMELYVDDNYNQKTKLSINKNSQLEINDNFNRLLEFNPPVSGLYSLNIYSSKQAEILIFDNYGRRLYDHYIHQNINSIIINLSENFKYHFLIKNYGSNIKLNFNITSYEFTSNPILRDNTYSFLLNNQSYQIYSINVTEFANYTFTTYSNTDTKLYIYRNGIKIGYNDDYLYYQDDSDPDYNSQLNLRLNEGIYYVLVQNVSTKDTIYLEIT